MSTWSEPQTETHHQPTAPPQPGRAKKVQPPQSRAKWAKTAQGPTPKRGSARQLVPGQRTEGGKDRRSRQGNQTHEHEHEAQRAS